MDINRPLKGPSSLTTQNAVHRIRNDLLHVETWLEVWHSRPHPIPTE